VLHFVFVRDVDKVHDLIDDMAEQTQIANEISNAISNPVGFSNDIDEDELLKELEELQDEDLESELLNIPNAPSTNLPQSSNKGSFSFLDLRNYQ
jgi:charged multivesicular body protein 4